MQRIKTALQQSWEHDHIAFIYEMFGTFFTVAGALLLALTAEDPNMKLVYPIYQIGTVSLMYAYYRRQMVWSIGLTSFFVVINIIGFIKAFGG